MSSTGVPSTSAAIWPRIVSAPVPRSVAPNSRLNEPSSLILMLAPPMSRTGDGAAVHAHGEADSPPDMRPIGGFAPIRVGPPMPPDGPLPLGNTLLHAARVTTGMIFISAAAFTQFGRDVERVADFRPVHSLEFEDVHPQRGGDVVHVGLEGEQGLRSSVAAVGAGHRNIGVDDIAVEPLVRTVVGAEPAQTRSPSAP